jgi:hypothetical protein
MLIAQQIIGLILAGFSVAFMLWFLVNLIRDSRARYPRHAHPPVEESQSWQVKTFSPQVSSPQVRIPQSPVNGGLRPVPSFGQGSRSPHVASR